MKQPPHVYIVGTFADSLADEQQAIQVLLRLQKQLRGFKPHFRSMSFLSLSSTAGTGVEAFRLRVEDLISNMNFRPIPSAWLMIENMLIDHRYKHPRQSPDLEHQKNVSDRKQVILPNHSKTEARGLQNSITFGS